MKARPSPHCLRLSPSFLNISAVPHPYFCISASAVQTFILVTQSSFARLPLPYLSCSRLTENTYIIFVAEVPTGGKSADGLDRDVCGEPVRGQGHSDPP